MALPVGSATPQASPDPSSPDSSFAQIDQSHPSDMAALTAHQSDPATRANGMLAANPGLVDHPAFASSLLSQPNGTGEQLGMASHFVSAAGSVHHGVVEGSQSRSPNNSGWFSGLWHGVANTWDNFRHQAASMYNVVGGVQGGAQTYDEPLSQRIGGYEAGAKSLASGAKAMGTEAVSKGASILSQGMANYQNGHWSFTADPGEARKHLNATLDSLKNDVAVGANPFNRQSVWWLMPHMAAFAISMARRRGWAYTMQYMTPYILSGIATGGALTGTGEAAAGTGEAATVADAAPAEAAATTPSDVFSAEGIRGRAEAPPEPPADVPPADVPPADVPPADVPPARGKVFQAASAAANFITKPLSVASHVLNAMAKPGTDLRMNAMYLSANAGITNDPHFADLWKQTSNGIPVDENGKPMGNVGSDIAGYLGAPSGTLNKMIADPVNFYANFLGSDPLGAGLKVIGATRTFDSVGGLVGHFFHGMGIRTPEDVYTVSSEYRRVNRAFSWMASHSAGAIEDTFKGLFKGDAGRSILDQLGKATTVPEVQKIWADMASGEGFVRNMAPSMSLYQLIKASFKYGDQTFRVEDALAGTPSDVQATAPDIQKTLGVSPWPLDSANSAVANGREALAMRARNLAGKYFTQILHSRPMYFNEDTQTMESFIISKNSVGVAHAVGDQLIELRYPRAARVIAQDAILHASSSELNNVVFNVYKDAMTRATLAAMKTSALDSVKVALERDLFTELSNRMGALQAGSDGVMVNGSFGYEKSLVGGKNMALDSTQLAELHFPRSRDLMNYARRAARIADEMTHAQDVAPGVDRILSPEAIDRRAAFANSNLTGMAKRLEDVAKGLETETKQGPGEIVGVRFNQPWNEKLAATVEGNDKGFVTQPKEAHDEMVAKAEQLKQRIKMASDLRKTPEQLRAYGLREGIINRLTREISQRGETLGLTYDQVDQVKQFADQIGHGLFDDVRIAQLSRAKGVASVAGNYEFNRGLVRIFEKGIANPEGINRTLIHELWHHLSGYASTEELTGLKRELNAARAKFLKAHPIEEWFNENKGSLTKDEKKYLGKLIENGNHLDPTKVNWEFIAKSRKLFSYLGNDGYRLTNLDEWFAERMYDRTATRLSSRNSLVEAGHRFLSALVASIGRISGRATSERLFRKFWNGRYEDDALNSGRSITSRLTGRKLAIAGREAESGAQHDAYTAKLNEITDAIRNATKDVAPGDTIGHNRAFVNVFLQVRNNLRTTEQITNLIDQWTIESKMLRSGDPMVLQQKLNELNAKLPPGTLRDIGGATGLQSEQLKGEVAALRRATDEMTARLQKESITIDDLKKNIMERNPNATEEQAAELAQKIQRIRSRNPRYRNGFNFFVDGINRYQSDVFVPLALFSGGWGLRVGTSEFLLNAFREGGARMIQTKLLTSYAKHETGKGFFTAEAKNFVDRMMEKPLFTGSYIDMQRSKALTYPQKVLSSTLRVALKSILEMRDLAGGTLHGIEGNLIVWTPRTERMFDRVIGALMDHAPGGLPMGVHSTGSIVTSEAMRQGLLVGDDGRMETVAANRSYTGSNADNVNYHKSLRNSLVQLHEGEQMRVGVNAIYDATRKMDLSKPITQATVDSLIAKARDASLAKLDSMSESELSAFGRHSAKGDTALSDEAVLNSLRPAERERIRLLSPEAQQTFFAHYDWAQTLAYHDLHTVMGSASNGMWKIHEPLLEMAHSGNVAATPDLKAFIDKLPPRSEPLQIITETHKEEDAKGMINRIAGQIVHTDIIRRTTDLGFRTVLGPMVNSLVRDSVYLGVFDGEMERLQGMVDKGLITEMTQKISAHSNSVVEMSKYVHNPLDRTAFESSMRWLAPFYFAQNQAWRRALRMASTDPGAAEKYLKMSLLMTNYVSVMGTKGNSLVTVPGSTWFSKESAYLAHDGPWGKSMLGALDIGMGAWVSALNSILPTGSEAGVGVLENIVRPSAGPFVSTTVKEAQHVLGLYNVPYVTKVGNAILGPVGAHVSVTDGLFPSSFFRNLYMGLEEATNHSYAATASTQAAVLVNAVENKYMTYYDAAAQQLHVNELTGTTKVKVEALARSIADTQTITFLQPNNVSGQLQEFVDQIHATATILFLTKTALSMGSPFTLSLQKTFANYPGFQAIMNEKLPSGRPKYTFEEAANLWTQKDPAGMFTFLGTTISSIPGASYPQTQAAADLIANHPYIVKKYPTGAAYLAQRTGGYSPDARQAELTNQLRSMYNLNDTQPGGRLYQQLLVVMGNDYYYNQLQPQYQNPDGTQTYEQYKALTKATQNYVNFVNPTWGGYMNGKDGKWVAEVQAVSDMKQMFNDKNIPASVFGGQDDKNMYELMMARYDGVVQAYKAATSSTDKFNIESKYYNDMTALAGSGALSSALSYFITNVLRNLPTAKDSLLP